jgi:Uma2 family endonuclease
MNVPVREPWTQEQFFTWAEAQDVRYEFDGLRPVAITGGNAGHSAIGINLQTALRNRLRGSGCRPYGPDAGIETVGKAVRYPDALVTCSEVDLTARTIPGVVVVFEVVTPSSGRIDRIVKVREYAAVPSIRRYVILESTGIGLTVMERAGRVTTLTTDDILRMPETGIEIPVIEFYEDLVFPDEAETSGEEYPSIELPERNSARRSTRRTRSNRSAPPR